MFYTTEYKILTNSDTEKLSAEVTEHVKKGWQLHGHLTGGRVNGYGGGQLFHWAQAMVWQVNDYNHE